MSCLSQWFPRLALSGVPVPRTIIIPTGVELVQLLDGRTPDGFGPFIKDLEAACAAFGYPCFLRTGQTSGKHQWNETCWVMSADELPQRVAALVEFSHVCDFMGLPENIWCVREPLKTEPQFTAFRGMPITRERRYFIADGRVKCRHPYWPAGAFKDEPSGWQDKLTAMNVESDAEVDELIALSERAGRMFKGEWSLDWLHTIDRGWVAIDMARAETSWHWPSCPNCPKGMHP